jgi:hypothetical protein
MLVVLPTVGLVLIVLLGVDMCIALQMLPLEIVSNTFHFYAIYEVSYVHAIIRRYVQC